METALGQGTGARALGAAGQAQGSGGTKARQMRVRQGGSWCKVRLLVAYGT